MHLDSIPSFGPAADSASAPSDQKPPEGLPLKSVPALAAALAKAQGEIENAKADAENPHFKSNYADLASVWNAVRAPLSKNGLAVMQSMVSDGREGWGLKTTLFHSSGEAVSNVMPLFLQRRDMQGLGGAITYARRYALSALVGVAQEDLDGEDALETLKKENAALKAQLEAGRRKPNAQVKPKETNTAGPSAASNALPGPNPGGAQSALSDAQLARLFTIVSEKGWTKDQLKLYMVVRWEVQSTRDLTRDQYDALVSTIERGSFGQARAMLISQGVTTTERMPEG